MHDSLALVPVECKLFDYMTANFDNYVTLWQHCFTVSAATERAKPANSKIFTNGEDNRDLRHIIIKKVPHRMIQFTAQATVSVVECLPTHPFALGEFVSVQALPSASP